MLFMGEEVAASTPFYFFTDHEQALGESIRAARIRDHAAYQDWSEAGSGDAIAHPQAVETFLASRLQWDTPERDERVLRTHRQLLALRVRYLPQVDRHQQQLQVYREDRLFSVLLHDDRGREVIACGVNFSSRARALPDYVAAWVAEFATRPLDSTPAGWALPADSAVWLRPSR